MKFHKRQLILASLVVALGTAVYLNWQFSGNKKRSRIVLWKRAHRISPRALRKATPMMYNSIEPDI